MSQRMGGPGAFIAFVGVVMLVLAIVDSGFSSDRAFILGCFLLVTSGLWAIAAAIPEGHRTKSGDDS
ncbi:MAG: hypothetical protein GX596_06970 [Propionibacterium sp.]|nr:hypothetical protein [Propionibacterium sp.]